MQIYLAKELMVYQKSFVTAMAILDATKRFPREELYALTSRIRRSSRSVCNNLREAWAKRRYEPHFISKLTDCDGETDTSLDFALACGYLSRETHEELSAANAEIARMLSSIIRSPHKFLLKT